MASMWRYIHARTVARVIPRLRPPVADHSLELNRFLRATVEARRTFAILQIGAYDGVANDSVRDLLRDYAHVRAVLLEPQPRAFAALHQLWRDTPRIVPLQAALAETCGERPLYVIAEQRKHLHPFAGQIASFSRAYVENECARYVWRPSADFVASVPVQTLDWRTLAERYGPFDFVAIDTEGYDGEILHQMDLSRRSPGLILYEHRHLDKDMRERCVRRLEAAGYIVRQVNKADTFASRIGPPGF
jgi:FkbM family methyltransferase